MVYRRKDRTWDEMLDSVSEKLAYDREVVRDVVLEHYYHLQEKTQRGYVVKIPGWGRWMTQKSAARYRNVPKVGRRYFGPTTRVRFEPSKRWRELNQSGAQGGGGGGG